MKPAIDNRAVSAMFRVWGPPGRSLQGDKVRRLAGRGAHAAEGFVLGAVISVVVMVILLERLAAWLGPVWALILAAPSFVVALHVVGIAIGLLAKGMDGLGGGRAEWAWRGWALVLTAWAWWAWNEGGWVRWAATGWFGIVGFNLLSAALLGWHRLMLIPGRGGSSLRVGLAIVLHLAVIPLLLAAGWWGLLWWVVLTASWAWGTFVPNSMVFGPVISRCDGAGVWLTIDDGPDPETTPRLLDLLDCHGACATFFLIGERVDRHPNLAREIVARGHEVGNHTGTHPRAIFWAAGPVRTGREVRAGSIAIQSATGATPRWFRAPVGHCNYFVHPIASKAGMRVVGWSRRGFDGVRTDVEAILAHLTRNLQRGEIVVVHDATPVAVEVLAGVLKRMDELGLRAELPEAFDGGTQDDRRSTSR